MTSLASLLSDINHVPKRHWNFMKSMSAGKISSLAEPREKKTEGKSHFLAERCNDVLISTGSISCLVANYSGPCCV